MACFLRFSFIGITLIFSSDATAQNLVACFAFDSTRVQDNLTGNNYSRTTFSRDDRFLRTNGASESFCTAIGLGNDPRHMPTNCTISLWASVVQQCSLSRAREFPIITNANINFQVPYPRITNYAIEWNSAGQLTAVLGGITLIGNAPYPRGNGWANYILTFNDTLAALYHNGNLVDTKRLQTPMRFNSDSQIWMGTSLLSLGATNLTVDDLMIYDAAMNEAQVLAHYQANAQCAAFPTALDEVDSAGGALKIFPNPTNGHFEIENKSNVIFAIYTVHDMTGRILSQGNFDSGSFELSFLPNGLYLLSIVDEKGRSYHDKFQIIK